MRAQHRPRRGHDARRERARSVIGRYLSRSHRDHPEHGCPLPSAAPDVARAGEPYREALGTELHAFIEAFARIIGGADARQLSLGLIALSYGALSLSRTFAGTPSSDEVLAAARALAERGLSGATVEDPTEEERAS